MQRPVQVLVLVVLAACGRHEPPPAPAPVEVVPAATAEAGAEVPAAKAASGEAAAPRAGLPGDPQAMYEACRERVEGPEQAGECETDADCVAAGCSREMCVAAASARGLMSGCEVRPCFQVLESCGCQEGVCRWTVSADAPARPFGRKLPLPAELEAERAADQPASQSAGSADR